MKEYQSIDDLLAIARGFVTKLQKNGVNDREISHRLVERSLQWSDFICSGYKKDMLKFTLFKKRVIDTFALELITNKYLPLIDTRIVKEGENYILKKGRLPPKRIASVNLECSTISVSSTYTQSGKLLEYLGWMMYDSKVD